MEEDLSNIKRAKACVAAILEHLSKARKASTEEAFTEARRGLTEQLALLKGRRCGLLTETSAAGRAASAASAGAPVAVFSEDERAWLLGRVAATLEDSAASDIVDGGHGAVQNAADPRPSAPGAPALRTPGESPRPRGVSATRPPGESPRPADPSEPRAQ